MNLQKLLVLFALGSLWSQATAALEVGETYSDDRDAHGKYTLSLLFGKPEFSGSLRNYSDFYGEENVGFSLGGDYRFVRKALSLGVGLRGGIYVDRGKARVSAGSALGDKDSNGTISLTLIPLQTVLIVGLKPTWGSWLAIDAWGGLEYLIFRESRVNGSASESGFYRPIRFGAVSMIQDSESDETEGTFVNGGSKVGIVTGVAVHILLNHFDEATVNSLESSLGLGAVYLSPFFEMVNQISDKANFSRTVLGLAFTFESSW